MVYLDTERVELRYHLPLNEIIYDFFDVKIPNKRLCVIDYELEDYRQSSLSS